MSNLYDLYIHKENVPGFLKDAGGVYHIEGGARTQYEHSTESHGSSPLQVLKTQQQHVAANTKMMLEGGMELTMGEDRAAPLITEVCSPMPTS